MQLEAAQPVVSVTRDGHVAKHEVQGVRLGQGTYIKWFFPCLDRWSPAWPTSRFASGIWQVCFQNIATERSHDLAAQERGFARGVMGLHRGDAIAAFVACRRAVSPGLLRAGACNGALGADAIHELLAGSDLAPTPPPLLRAGRLRSALPAAGQVHWRDLVVLVYFLVRRPSVRERSTAARCTSTQTRSPESNSLSG